MARPLPAVYHPDDVFAPTRMPLGDHIEDLRRHLFRAVAGLGTALVLVFLLDLIGYLTKTPIGIARPVMGLITQPVEGELQKFYDRRLQRVLEDLRQGKESTRLANLPRELELEVDFHDLVQKTGPLLGIKPHDWLASVAPGRYVPLRVRLRPLEWTLALIEAQRLLGPRPQLATLSVSEAMMVYFKVAFVCGILLSSPWVFRQLWTFVAAGLYAHEKRPVCVYLPLSVGLFAGGVVFCQFVVIPPAVEAMLWFNEWLDLEPALRLTEWLGFAIFLPLLFGLSFQTPLIMLLTHRLGLVSRQAYQNRRRLAWFVLAMFAAATCPSNDLIGMLFLWVPLCVLYELGILLCRISGGHVHDGGEDRPEGQWFEV